MAYGKEIYEGFITGIKKAEEALEKQKPKSPIPHIVKLDRIKIRNSFWCKGTTIYKCPRCDNYISITNNYCHECGQAIDWNTKKGGVKNG